MLHNIRIEKGLSTELAVQGSFINVVFCAGEIDVRIRLMNEQVFQTKLVSGMAFPVPSGFKSVSVSSEVSQQTRIWLSSLPLNYSPIDAKLVGSSALISTSVKAAYGPPREIVPIRIGRKKMTINASKTMFIGSESVTTSSAIEIPANTNFQMETQAAVWGYSIDPADKVEMVVDLTKGLMPEAPVFFGGGSVNKGFIVYLKGAGKYAVNIGGGVYIYDANESKYVGKLADAKSNSAGFLANGDVVILSGSVFKIISQADGTVSGNLGRAPTSTTYFSVHKESGKIVASLYSTMQLHVGTIDGDFVLKPNPLSGTPDTYLRDAIYTSTGRIFIMSDNYYATSDDDGNTFSAVQDLPAKYGTSSEGRVVMNSLNGDIYYGDIIGNLYRSNDDGFTFHLLKVSTLKWTGLPKIEAIAGVGDMIAITNGSGVSYSTNNGVSWTDIIFDTFQHSAGGIVISIHGILTTHNRSYKIFRGLSVAAVGGLNVRILEEAN